MIGKVRALDYNFVRTKIDELCVNNMFFNGDTVKLMKEIVPEYISYNSELCKHDKTIEQKESKKSNLKVLHS